MSASPESRPYSAAADRNQGPILEVLRLQFAAAATVLEIGSGTGQHAVYFARAMPWLRWQPSDLPRLLPGIRSWVRPAGLDNLLAPIELDVTGAWPAIAADAMFSANTAHIMAWEAVEAMIAGAGRLLPAGGRFCLYGPFNCGGEFTSDSNRQFDAMLRARDARMGLRDIEAIGASAVAAGLELLADYAMPANNRLLVLAK